MQPDCMMYMGPCASNGCAVSGVVFQSCVRRVSDFIRLFLCSLFLNFLFQAGEKEKVKKLLVLFKEVLLCSWEYGI